MTLHREKDGIVFECDECGDFESTGTSDFNKAREAIREEGWQTQLTDGQWEHTCRECSQ